MLSKCHDRVHLHEPVEFSKGAKNEIDSVDRNRSTFIHFDRNPSVMERWAMEHMYKIKKLLVDLQEC